MNRFPFGLIIMQEDCTMSHKDVCIRDLGMGHITLLNYISLFHHIKSLAAIS